MESGQSHPEQWTVSSCLGTQPAVVPGTPGGSVVVPASGLLPSDQESAARNRLEPADLQSMSSQEQSEKLRIPEININHSFITPLLGSKAKTELAKQLSFIQRKNVFWLRLYRKKIINGHFSI